MRSGIFPSDDCKRKRMLRRRFLLALSAGSVCIPQQALRTSSDAVDSTKTTGSMDCSIPACHSKAEMFKAAMQRAKVSGSDGQQKGGPSKNTASSSATSSTSQEHHYSSGCPVDKDELGIGAWNLLHTIAATYKEDPSEQEQQMMVQFFKILSLIYPCPHCAEVRKIIYNTGMIQLIFTLLHYLRMKQDFQKSIAKSPPEVSSRSTLSLWLCKQHNEVNEKLGKPLFDCNMRSLDRRWREGHEKCWE